MIRTQRGKNMKDKPLRLVRIRLLDAKTEQPLFKKYMWLCVWGERRMELNAEQIYWAYRNRYDIEHFFRFGKQKLLLDKFQTPDEQHLQNWMEVVNLAYWLLFVAKDEAKHDCHKWQQYDKNYQKRIKHEFDDRRSRRCPGAPASAGRGGRARRTCTRARGASRRAR